MTERLVKGRSRDYVVNWDDIKENIEISELLEFVDINNLKQIMKDEGPPRRFRTRIRRNSG